MNPTADTIDAKDLSLFLRECVNIVRESGKIVCDAWDKPRSVMHKGRVDLVTTIDLAVQSFLQEKLTGLLPDAAFMGEENTSPDADLSREYCWIVDPVDGTTNFVHRFPMVGISVALWRRCQPLLGVIYAPVMGECFHAAAGLGSFCNDCPIHVSDTSTITDALVSTGFPYDMRLELEDILARLRRILPAAQGVRRPGAASLDMAYVACGRLDAYYEHTIKPWDVAAGIIIVGEAGGVVSGFDGSAYALGHPILADNGHIHEKMIQLLNI